MTAAELAVHAAIVGWAGAVVFVVWIRVWTFAS